MHDGTPDRRSPATLFLVSRYPVSTIGLRGPHGRRSPVLKRLYRTQFATPSQLMSATRPRNIGGLTVS